MLKSFLLIPYPNTIRTYKRFFFEHPILRTRLDHVQQRHRLFPCQWHLQCRWSDPGRVHSSYVIGNSMKSEPHATNSSGVDNPDSPGGLALAYIIASVEQKEQRKKNAPQRIAFSRSQVNRSVQAFQGVGAARGRYRRA